MTKFRSESDAKNIEQQYRAIISETKRIQKQRKQSERKQMEYGCALFALAIIAITILTVLAVIAVVYS